MARNPDKQRCKVTHNARGEPCKPHWAMHGQQVCGAHGGRAGQNKRAAARRKEIEGAQKLLAQWTGEFKLAGGRMQVDPTQALMWLMESAALNVAFIESKVRELRQGKGGKNDEGEYEPGLWTHIPEVGDIPTPWVRMYNEERDKLARFAKDCISAGIAELMVRSAESNVRLLVEVMEASWERLKLSPAQKDRERKLVAKELRDRRAVA